MNGSDVQFIHGNRVWQYLNKHNQITLMKFKILNKQVCFKRQLKLFQHVSDRVRSIIREYRAHTPQVQNYAAKHRPSTRQTSLNHYE